MHSISNKILRVIGISKDKNYIYFYFLFLYFILARKYPFKDKPNVVICYFFIFLMF